MHYYQFNIKDWALHTAHLSLEEEAIYHRLVNYYYDTESPILDDSRGMVFRRCRIADHDLANNILQEFFVLEDKAWTHKRCDQEIAKYHAMADGGKKGAEARWGKRKGSDSPPIEPPMLTNNQEPIPTTHIKTNRIAPKVAIPIGVSESVWNDFLTLRKTKKMAVTLTALRGITREAEKANKPLEEVLAICCERGWGGFKAEWILESKSAHGNKNQEWRNNDSLMMAKASELGLHTVGLQRFEIINKIAETMRSRGL